MNELHELVRLAQGIEGKMARGQFEDLFKEITQLRADLAASQKTITDWEHGALKQIDDAMERNRLLQDLAASRANYEGLRATLQVMLDDVDYTSGACRVNEMIGAVLPITLIWIARADLARAALAAQSMETTK